MTLHRAKVATADINWRGYCSYLTNYHVHVLTKDIRYESLAMLYTVNLQIFTTVLFLLYLLTRQIC